MIIESTGTLDAEHAFALIAVALLVVEVDDDQVALAASGRPCGPVLACRERERRESEELM